MANYIFVTTDGDGQKVTHIEADHRTEAAKQFFNSADAPEVDEATLYRVAAAPVKVRVETETVTKVVVE